MSTSPTTEGTVRRATIPSPRPPADDTIEQQPAVEPQTTVEPEPTLPEPRYPWPEPWGSARGARPRSEYWDVATASWHSRGPNPRD